MKITFLNGSPTPGALDRRLDELQACLEAQGKTVTRLDVRSLGLACCIGCWGCWGRTPGVCTCRDGSQAMGRAVINADFVLWAAPLKMGYPSAVLKMAMDKHLPLIHPYVELDQGEIHHLRRYPRSPRVGLLLEREPATDAQDLQIVTDMFCRTALNFKTRLEFSLTSDTPAEEVAGWMLATDAHPLPLPKAPGGTTGVAIAPPHRLTLFNGSPRGRRGNTPILLGELAKGFGGETEMHHLIQLKQMEQHVRALAAAECAVIGFPLYTDAMPAPVKFFLEALEPLAGRGGSPPLGFLVQSGFPEALHSRYVERYLEKLAARLGSPYLGTIVKGGGEGVRTADAGDTRSLFNGLQALGRGLAHEGRLDPHILAMLAVPERFPALLGPLLRLILRRPSTRAWIDVGLKRNGVYERRFDRPLAD
jgi:multimeric flavodoxin WrbA